MTWRGPNITTLGHVTLFDVILHFIVSDPGGQSARQIWSF